MVSTSPSLFCFLTCSCHPFGGDEGGSPPSHRSSSLASSPVRRERTPLSRRTGLQLAGRPSLLHLMAHRCGHGPSWWGGICHFCRPRIPRNGRKPFSFIVFLVFLSGLYNLLLTEPFEEHLSELSMGTSICERLLHVPEVWNLVRFNLLCSAV